jgi:ankyrin repeat protein
MRQPLKRLSNVLNCASYLNPTITGARRRPSAELPMKFIVEDELKMDEPMNIEVPKIERRSRWNTLNIVVNATNGFLKPEVVPVKSAATLEHEVQEACSRKFPSSTSQLHSEDPIVPTAEDWNDKRSKQINDFQDRMSFFRALERGKDSDFDKIKKFLQADPKRFMHEPDSPSRSTNKPNPTGYSPLYVACKNGNLKLAKLLVDFKANPYQDCKVKGTSVDSPLIVGARWGHLDVVKYLLNEEFYWEKKILQKALDETPNKSIREIIKSELRKRKQSSLTAF